MNKYEQLFDKLNNPVLIKDETQKLRLLLISVLKDFAYALERNPGSGTEIAYKIAGIMATEFARCLNENDTIDEILTIAGELEVNPQNADELREELIKKIDMLVE